MAFKKTTEDLPVAAPETVAPEVLVVDSLPAALDAPEPPTAENDAALALPARLAAEQAAVEAQKDLKLVAETPLVGYEEARAQLGSTAEVAEEKVAEGE